MSSISARSQSDDTVYHDNETMIDLYSHNTWTILQTEKLLITRPISNTERQPH